MHGDLVLFTGNANPELANKVSQFLDIPLSVSLISRYSDGEIRVELESSVRGKDVFVIQPTCYPANENIMELLIMIDALKRASAERITAVVPYYGYGRQERRNTRTPISAKLVADLLETSGINRIITMELHTLSVAGFFNVPIDHLLSKSVFYHRLQKLNLENMVIVSPDTGGVERARSLARLFNCELAFIDKRRDHPGVSKVMRLVGDVRDKTVVLFDDICDTGSSLIQASEVIYENGGKEIYAAITHPVFSDVTAQKLEESYIQKIFVTDSIPLQVDMSDYSRIEVLSVAEFIGKAILGVHGTDTADNLDSIMI
jgi:ribose-phosphate pyrophosphokinase